MDLRGGVSGGGGGLGGVGWGGLVAADMERSSLMKGWVRVGGVEEA